MEGLFNRLTVKPSEKVIVDRIRRNLLPYYVSQLALLDIDTINELGIKCKRIEESLTWSERYRPPVVNKNVNYLEPDLSCPGFYESISSNKVNISRTGGDSKKQNFSFSNQVSAVKCWNCSAEGHTHRECRRQRKIFCFGCGLNGVNIYNCPKCSGKRRPGEVQNNLINTPSTSNANRVFHDQKSPTSNDSAHFLEVFDPNQPPPPMRQNQNGQVFKKDKNLKNKSRK